DGQARLRVRAGGRVAQVCAFPSGLAQLWRNPALPRSLRATGDLDLPTATLFRDDCRRDPPALDEATPDAWHAVGAGREVVQMAIPIVPLVVATALFMENTDSTILATALPTIARDLGLDPISLKLAVTSYLVSLAVFIPVSGWVADRVGACTTFRLALAVFMIASIGCAFSNSLGQ